MMDDGRMTGAERELPAGWVWTTLAECAEVITGRTPSKSKPQNYGDHLPLVKPPELKNGIIDRAEDNLSIEGAREARVLPPRSVLVSCIGNLGKTGINRIPVAFNQQINAVIFPDSIVPEYGFYYFQSTAFRDWLDSVSSATTVTIVNKGKFQQARFPLAPPAEQRRIVAKIEELFTRLDAGVAALKRVQAALKRYKASVLKAACEGRLVPQDAADEPATILLRRIDESRRKSIVEARRRQLEKSMHTVLTGQLLSPHELLIQWLIEMVFRDFDLEHGAFIDNLVADFYSSVADAPSQQEQGINLIPWMDQALARLKACGLVSFTLNDQRSGWTNYAKSIFGGRANQPTKRPNSWHSESIMDRFAEMMESLAIREQGVKYVRRECLTNPVEKVWQKSQANMSKPDASSLPDLPAGWCWATIEQLAETIGGVTKGRAFKGKHTISLPYLRVANVQRGRLDLNEIKEIDLLENEVEKYRLRNGDIVLTEGGDWDKLGRSAIWHEQIPRCVHQNHIFRARLYLQDGLPEWLMYYTNSERGQQYFKDASKQTTNLASINLTQLKACPIPLPPLAEQRRIVAEVERRLSVVAEVEQTVAGNLARAGRLRQAILHRAFTGRLVPQDSNDEPAERLLERLRAGREASGERLIQGRLLEPATRSTKLSRRSASRSPARPRHK